MTSGGGDSSPPRPPHDRKGKSIAVPEPPRRKRVVYVDDTDDYCEMPTTVTPTQARPTPAGRVRSLRSPSTQTQPQTSGVRSLHMPEQTFGVRSLQTPGQTSGVRSLQTPGQTSGVRSLHIGASSSPRVTHSPSPTPSPRDVHGHTSQVSPPPSQTPPYRMIPVPGFRPTSTTTPSPVPTPTPSPPHTETFSPEVDVIPDDNEISDNDEISDDEPVIRLRDRRYVIRVERGGFLPCKPAAEAIRKTIRELYHYPWATWRDLNEDEQVNFFNAFRKKVAWRKSQEAAVWNLFHKKAALRLSDMLRGVRKLGSRPDWIGDQVYDRLRYHWNNDPKFLARCARNKKNRASVKGGNLHTGGCISMLQHAERMAKELGRRPHVDELHRRTHIRRGTSDFVDERARIAQDEFHRRLAQSNIPLDPTELEKLKRLLWEEVVGGTNRKRLYGTGGIYGNMVDSGASTSESLSPEARRLIQSLADQVARQQQLIDYVFSQSGIPAPPPDWQPPEQDQPAQQDQDAQHEQNDGAADEEGGDHMDHYERGY